MIEVNGAGKRFDETGWVFREACLQISRGESAVLVGPSGGGKSVLLKLLGGLLAPDEGSVSVQSQDVGMLFQKNALFDSMTVEENLLFPLKERKRLRGAEARQKAASFLESVGLAGTQKLYPDEISGGMQKRLGIARALIVEPEVMLYDEPTAGLDPVTSRHIASLILELRKRSGTTLVTVTNDLHRAWQIGDRVYFLAQGRLLAGGTPEQARGTDDVAFRQFITGSREGPLTSGLA